MCEEDGLNLSSSNLLRGKVLGKTLRYSLHFGKVFGRPDCFTMLKELVLNGAHLQRDFDIVHIQRLPHLERLHLKATGIGNEASGYQFFAFSGRLTVS
jgi:hypothetical protein